MFTKPKNILPEKEHGFTLIELIVVIIIVGILAAVGISQYSKTVERSRCVEVRTIFGQMRKSIYEFYWTNGSLSGMTLADLNVGTSADQIPSACRSTHYFIYGFQNLASTTVQMYSARCLSGGKPPQGSAVPDGNGCRCNLWITPSNPSDDRVDDWGNLMCNGCPRP